MEKETTNKKTNILIDALFNNNILLSLPLMVKMNKSWRKKMLRHGKKK